MRTARAQVWRGHGTVEIAEVPLPTPGFGEVLVAVRLATVCGSDLHTVLGHRTSPCPGVLGHEAVGDVIAVGPGTPQYLNGSPIRTGDRIVWGVTVACRSCDRCRAGRTAKCRSVRKVGHEPFDGTWALSGSYASHILLAAGAAAVKLPHGLVDAVAAPAACATATVMAAAEAAGPLTGQRVVVSGAGMLGLTAAALASEADADEVIIIDPDTDRRQSALAFGATRVASPTDAGLAEIDVAFELSGAATAVECLLGALAIGGRLVLAGSVSPGPRVAFDPEQLVRRWATVTGVHNYEPRHLQQAIDFLHRTSAVRPWASLVADPLPLEALNELLVARDGGPPRTAVKP
ncbi:zinc-binding dehydrogenase [Kribbella sp. CA-293567]|uniref:zinc-binding dehydrogenase n=1 Tax=Kribbella sp. CA-293567 TaxID=3002436 RepID=UPI0022DE13AC|nr:zinc-binding dehydrogenase [Kribbella sp. CA-293567]WBQ04424.1 zinc-binding dehydrogenase [Kribbella sp. CA-293567]